MLVRVMMAVTVNKLLVNDDSDMMVGSLFPTYMRTHAGVPD